MGILYNHFKYYKCQTPTFSLMSRSVAKMPVDSLLSYLQTRFRELLRTSDAFVQEKRVSDNWESHFISRDPNSTESSLDSWLRAVTSLLEMEPEVIQSLVQTSKMRTSHANILVKVSSPWLTLDQEPTALSSSCASPQPLISMEHMSFSAKSSKENRPWMPLSSSDLKAVKPRLHVSSPIAVNCKSNNEK